MPTTDDPPAGGAAGDNAQASPVRSVVRALDLLALFTEDHATWTVRELTETSGLAKTTVLRLVDTLQQRGLLWSGEQGRISAGPGLLRWASLAQTAWRVPEQARHVMRELSDACGETVNLYVRSGTTRICVEQQEGRRSVRHIVRVGDELPLWGGAASKVLLSGADERSLAAVLALDPHGRTIDQLRAELAEVAARGSAVSHGEREVGASGLAAPVVGDDGAVLAALALGGPTPRFTAEAVADFEGKVRDAASRISRIGIGGRA
ncbi:DNA-binding IclR family transcriptional regulator [Prauserella sediminis]|uniref:DNA-binding IclR family transcriptional regulator n=1 Tax=Prauserella sediminis TaxID=577680 RepID=A0A839XP22_9PSEU|nr:IclR family transcriptional regulator [Prauserella sediminis]MBB3662588.1 DNA-binding IclR family transcriptional regulator [Prauserella sediminis]